MHILALAVYSAIPGCVSLVNSDIARIALAERRLSLFDACATDVGSESYLHVDCIPTHCSHDTTLDQIPCTKCSATIEMTDIESSQCIQVLSRLYFATPLIRRAFASSFDAVTAIPPQDFASSPVHYSAHLSILGFSIY